VERADQLSGAATATANTDPDSLSFVLIKAGATGTAAAAANAANATAAKAAPLTPIYTLDGGPSMLNPHVGHEVEISGTVIAPAPARPAADAALSAPARVRVENVRTIAETCPRS